MSHEQPAQLAAQRKKEENHLPTPTPTRCTSTTFTAAGKPASGSVEDQSIDQMYFQVMGTRPLSGWASLLKAAGERSISFGAYWLSVS